LRVRSAQGRFALFALSLGFSTFAFALGTSSNFPGGVAPLEMLAAYARPISVPAPADNPITPAKAALGRMLFFDARLSRSGKTSCASCHNPSLAWEDGRRLAIGDNGSVLPRSTPTIIDAAWVEPLLWDGRADSLEAQARTPLNNPHEMGMPRGRLVSLAGRDPAYRKAFAKAYPGKAIREDLLLGAIATFERTVVSTTAPIDRRVAGDRTAITDSAERGLILFNTKAGCSSCHSGWRFTDDGFHDIGLPGKDLGRGKIVPGIEILQHSFKTPTLREVARRAPYMHDGSLPTLAAVIDYYDSPKTDRTSVAPEIKRLGLTVTEKADLIAFLNSLSGDSDAARTKTVSKL